MIKGAQHNVLLNVQYLNRTLSGAKHNLIDIRWWMSYGRNVKLFWLERHIQVDIIGANVPHLEHIPMVYSNQIVSKWQQQVHIMFVSTVDVTNVFSRSPGIDAFVARRIRVHSVCGHGRNIIRMETTYM